MDITVTFPGNKKVNAEFNGFVVNTDQPVTSGGDGTAPSPYQVFLSSLATCAGIYVLGFIQNRGLPTEGVKLIQHHDFDSASHRLVKIELEIILPKAIPEKYHEAIIRSANMCAVKKTIQEPPEIQVGVTQV